MSLKIMLVDDGSSSLKPMRPLAAPLGHTVLTFDDIQQIGERVEKQRFDVVFVAMSRLDALAVVRQIRGSQLNRGTTIVMLSATVDIAGMRQAFGEGADLAIPTPLTRTRLLSMLAAMDSAGWNAKRHRARLPLFTQVTCTWDGRRFPARSMNISESGMLLQVSADMEVSQEVALEFEIVEVHTSLSVSAQIVRREGTERIGVEFIALAPEDKNAIQLYVMGHLKDLTPPRDLSGIRTNEMFIPKS